MLVDGVIVGCRPDLTVARPAWYRVSPYACKIESTKDQARYTPNPFSLLPYSLWKNPFGKFLLENSLEKISLFPPFGDHFADFLQVTFTQAGVAEEMLK